MITRAKITKGFKFKINNGNHIISEKVFEIGGSVFEATFISEGGLFGKQMNIDKIGTKKIDLYTFDMLGNMLKREIRFEDMIEVTE
jgi:hypothetical protein